MPQARNHEQPSTRRARRRIIGVWVGLGLATVLLVAGHLGHRALVAKAALEDAQQQLTIIRSVLGQSEAPSTTALYGRLQADTSRAVKQTDDPVWRLAEHVPVIGANLVAFGQTATLVDTFVHDGVGPLARAADGIGLDSLKPHDGGIDIEPLKRLTPAMIDLDDAVRRADASVAEVDRTHVVAQLTTQLRKLHTLLAEVAPTIHKLRGIMPALYQTLGGEGTRHYLLIFQNNAEERASGGNPASMAMMLVANGKITLGRQVSSRDFPRPYRVAPYTPSGPGNGDWGTIYTDLASTYVTNITMTPDFPSTAIMARAMWRQVVGGTVDGVISFDPIALSHLLRVTGPVTLADRHTITSANAVSYLLYDVYAKHPDAKVQDAVFASAARAIFAALTNGQADPRAYLTALRPIVREQRLKLWSVRKAEEDLLRGTPLGTMLPDDNSRATVLGVYNNDDATSKMSYFMDERVLVGTNTCQARPVYTVTATVVNTLPAGRSRSLPEYVRAHQARIVPGGDRQWVQLLGPVGGQLVAMHIDGVKVRWGTSLNWKANTNALATGVPDRRPAVKGIMYGRPIGVVSLNLGPASSRTVTAEFVGRADDSTTVEVSHTPKVRQVPVTFAPATCGR
jgi:hypothetical protein